MQNIIIYEFVLFAMLLVSQAAVCKDGNNAELLTTSEGIEFKLYYPYEQKSIIPQFIVGEKNINLSIKVKNISDSQISIDKRYICFNNAFLVTDISGNGKSTAHARYLMTKFSFNLDDWLILQPKEEISFEIPHNTHTIWQTPEKGTNPGIGEPGRYFISYQYPELSIPIEVQKNLIEIGVPKSIYTGTASTKIEIEVIPPPIGEKNNLLEKVKKYIKRSFSKKELSEIEKTNGLGVDPYSLASEDQIITFLKCYTIAPKELQDLLIKNSNISGFKRSESVFIHLEMFDTEEAQRVRETMKKSAIIKYKDILAQNNPESVTERGDDVKVTPSEDTPQSTLADIVTNFRTILASVFVLIMVIVLIVLYWRK